MSAWQPIATAPRDGTVIRITNDPENWVYVKWWAVGEYWSDGDDIWWPKEVEGWLWNIVDH